MLRTGQLGSLCLGFVLALGAGAFAQDAHKAALVKIEGTPGEIPEPMAHLFGAEHATLRQLVNAIDKAARRDDIDSLVIQLDEAMLARTQVEELAAAIDRVQEQDKRVAVYAYTYGTTGLLLGAAADTVIVQEGGAVSFPGLYMEELFLGDTLRWIGLEPQFVQIGDYKGASEMFMNDEPSPAWEENISGLLDALYANLRAQMQQGRALTPEELDEAMRRAWLADAQTAIDVGLVDAAVDLPRLGARLYGREDIEWVTDLAGQESEPAMTPGDPMAAFQMFSMLMDPPEYAPTGPTIAVLHVNGPIIDGESSPGGLFGGQTTGSRTIRNALETILNEDEIRGVVVRIDSPGGSAIASEVIWQGLRRVAEQKPVWASVGSMAASGGYYVAVGADKIYVNPSSIVGSIGVVGGKISPVGLTEKLKINSVGRARGPRADLLGMNPWTQEQIEVVRDKMLETYDLFVDRVRAGRPGIDPAQTAEGRLFTGNEAVTLKMADAIGGLDLAVSQMAAELGLDDYDVMDYPAPKEFGELLEDMFGGFLAARAGSDIAGPFAAVRSLLGERTWDAARATLAGLLQLRREPVLLLLPRTIVIR